MKDLLKNLDRDFNTCHVKELLRTVYFIPENKNVSDLLAEMRQKRVHMAVILDEYGGTAGLITIEDLIEEIVGDIQDEYDSEEELIEPIPGRNAVMADARALVYDVAEALEVEFSEDTESETIGGLVFNNIGGIPSVGDEATYERLHMKVAEVKGHRVSKSRGRGFAGGGRRGKARLGFPAASAIKKTIRIRIKNELTGIN